MEGHSCIAGNIPQLRRVLIGKPRLITGEQFLAISLRRIAKMPIETQELYDYSLFTANEGP